MTSTSTVIAVRFDVARLADDVLVRHRLWQAPPWRAASEVAVRPVNRLRPRSGGCTSAYAAQMRRSQPAKFNVMVELKLYGYRSVKGFYPNVLLTSAIPLRRSYGPSKQVDKMLSSLSITSVSNHDLFVSSPASIPK